MKILPSSFLVFFCFLKLSSQEVVINEICSSNSTVIEDGYGEFSDWVELYNNSSQTINLENYGLSDDSDEPRKWLFPETEITPNGFLLVFASGQDSMIDNELHTNFKIKQTGESLILTNGQGQIIDEVVPLEIATDQSFSRTPDGASNWEITTSPTPNISNLITKEISISHTSGFYKEPFSFEIRNPNPNQKIYYTLNGNTPTENDFLYTQPIQINSNPADFYPYSNIPTTPTEGPDRLQEYIWKAPESVFTGTVIRFAAFENGERKSEVFSKTYFIGEENKYDFPVVSVVTDSLNLFGFSEGIYIPGERFDTMGFDWFPFGNFLNEGREWERDIHLTWFENGQVGFETDAGFRMHGNGSTAFSQKSFKVYFRNEYGLNELEYPVFQDADNEQFKRLLFRSGGNDFLRSRFKDPMLQTLISDLDVYLQNFRPVVVFINGEYWGLHHLRDKYDRYHLKYNFGFDEEEVNILKHCGQVEEGSNREYNELINFVESNDLSIQSNFEYVEQRVDISNFIDFQIAEIYFANYDWPCNNFKIWKSNEPEDKWRFLIFDLDFTFGESQNTRSDYLSLEHASSTSEDWPYCQCSNVLFRKLLDNKDFQKRFIERFTFCLNNTFSRNRVVALIDEFETLFENAMPEHIARWQYPEDMNAWRKEIEKLRVFANERPCHVQSQLLSFFDLDTIDFDCSKDFIANVDGRLKIFPNPNNGNFSIANATEIDIEDAELTIFNAVGQIVFNKYNYTLTSKEKRLVSRLKLPMGLYTVVLENETTRLLEKLVIWSD